MPITGSRNTHGVEIGSINDTLMLLCEREVAAAADSSRSYCEGDQFSFYGEVLYAKRRRTLGAMADVRVRPEAVPGSPEAYVCVDL